MRVIKLSPSDEDMGTRDEVLSFFNTSLRRKSCKGKFGLTEAKSRMEGIVQGTLLLFCYQTECMFLGRAASGIHPGDKRSNAFFVVDVDSLFPVAGPLIEFENALRKRGLSEKTLVHTQAWPTLPDECEPFTLEYFQYPSGSSGFTAQQLNRMENKLHVAMLELYKCAGREADYWAKRYLAAVKRSGGLATARRMLIPSQSGKVYQGLQALIDVGRADELSVEAIALRPEFRGLFSPAELAEASRRLALIPSASKQKPVPNELNFSDNVDETATYLEGAVKTVRVNAYERNPKARAACLKKHGYKCLVCSTDFSAIYGALGKGFIHVHHKKPQALWRKEYRINPVIDLAPVCPNCHAMLHTRTPPLTIEQLRNIYLEQKSRSS